MPRFNLPSEVAIDCGFTMTTKAEGGNGNGLAPQMEHQLKVIKDFGIVYSDVLRCTWPAVGPDVHGKPVKIYAIVLSNTCTDELPRERESPHDDLGRTITQ